MARRERASLKYIMDTSDDEPLSHINTKDSPSSVNQSRDIYSASAYASTKEHDQRQLPDSARKLPTPGLYHQPTTTASSSTSSPALTSRPVSVAEASSSGVEEMNPMHRGYGGPGSGAAGGSSQPNRPMATQPEPPVKLTPITGRVSRAKKGVPVHVCDVCKPPKTFTRAEHLRRHQLSHQTPGHPCQYPGCDRAFHRADLLARHQTRHEQEGDRASTSTGGRGRGDSRAPSVNSPDGGFSASHASSSMPSSEYATPYTTTHSQPGSSGDRGSYPPSSGGPQGQGDRSYVLESSASHLPSGSPFPEFAAPRTPIYIVTEGLPSTSQLQNFDMPPGLQFDSSPWSGSGISTPLTAMAVIIEAIRQTRTYPWEGTLATHQFLLEIPSTCPLHLRLAPPGSLHPIVIPTVKRSTPAFRFLTRVSTTTQPTTKISLQFVVRPHRTCHAQAMVSRHKDLAFSGTLHDPAFLTAFTLPRPTRNAIPAFLDTYWKRFDILFPLVHRQSFEAAPNDVLRCAMAAVATQFLDGREDRSHGYILHDIVSQEVKRAPQWNVQIMQAILLCEFFARFRGSSFQSCSSFSRLAMAPILNVSLAGRQSSSPRPHLFLARSCNYPEGRWGEWVEAEARRRMLAACFVLDVHTTMYHQLPLVHRFNTPCPPIPLTAASKDLWTARSAEAWETIGAAGWPNNEPCVLSENTVSIEKLASAPPMDNAIYLASEALRLPRSENSTRLDLSTTTIDLSDTRRISNLFGDSPTANTYLALHYTPLHDLLAVSGDSWLFARKITGPRDYLQHQSMLKAWSGSVRSAAATKFAAKALVAFLDNGNDYNDNDNYNHDDSNTASYIPDHTTTKSPRVATNAYLEWNKNDISDQWALYVNALICWAFGNPHSRATNKTTMPAPTTANSSNTQAFESFVRASEEIRQSEAAALKWLRTIADLPQAEDVLAFRGQRRDALGVVAMVRRRLQAEAAIGGKSKLLVDSCAVLSRLEEAAARV
ncbi:hypothetical protein PG995_009556 [Apiospora arundinis]